MNFLSLDGAREFLVWLASGAGMGVVSLLVTQLVKKYLKWENGQAKALSVAVSLVVGTTAFFALKYQWYVYIEEFWPVLAAWGTLVVSAFGISQYLYKRAPRRGD